VQIFAQLAASDKSPSCIAFAHTGGKDIPKSTLSQHFKVLREAGLVRSERIGVEMKNSSRCQEIESRFPGLIPAIGEALKAQSGQRATKRKPR
jgi:DNA-binding transcriptional ArsR family regulator